MATLEAKIKINYKHATSLLKITFLGKIAITQSDQVSFLKITKRPEPEDLFHVCLAIYCQLMTWVPM